MTATPVVKLPYLKEWIAMSRKRFALGAALALVGLMAAAPRADAAYSYTASLVINSVSGSGGSIVNTPGTGATFTSTNGTVVTLGNITNPNGTTGFLVGQPLSANVGNVGVTTGSATPDTFTINYTIFGTLTEPFPGGPSITAFTNGLLTVTGAQFSGGASAGSVTNVYTGPFTAGPGFLPDAIFFVSVPAIPNAMFAAPTVNGVGGNLGALITSTTVPEPASLAMVGLGLVGVGGAGFARRRRLV